MRTAEQEDIRSAVRHAYSDAALNPQSPHPFPVGRTFAESIGYSADVLAGIPEACVTAFAGVSNISVTADIPIGSTVLDLGCGSGLDSFIAARRAGRNGRILGVDFSECMLARAGAAKAALGIANVLFCQAAAEELPIASASMSVGLVNGIFNLNPDRAGIFAELARVLKPGGSVCAAELIALQPQPEKQRTVSDWFA